MLKSIDFRINSLVLTLNHPNILVHHIYDKYLFLLLFTGVAHKPNSELNDNKNTERCAYFGRTNRNDQTK